MSITPGPMNHLIRNPNPTGGTFISAPVTDAVPAGYLPLGYVNFRGGIIDHVARANLAGSPCLYRRADGKVVARELISAAEVGEILWSGRAGSEVFTWAPARQ
jgi:hypothetical protein